MMHLLGLIFVSSALSVVQENMCNIFKAKTTHEQKPKPVFMGVMCIFLFANGCRFLPQVLIGCLFSFFLSFKTLWKVYSNDAQSLQETVTCSIVWILICISLPKMSCVLFGSQVLMPRYAGRVSRAFNRQLYPGSGEMLNSPLLISLL